MIIVSDIHLCDGTGSFYKNHDRFMDFLDFVGKGGLLIAGDFVDLWRWSPDSIFNGPNKDIIARIKEKKNCMLTPGNHDLNMKVMETIFGNRIRMQVNMYDYVIFHGHQIDPILDTPQERWVAKTAAWIIQRLNWKWLHSATEYLTSAHRSNDRLIETIKKEYPEETKIICGHSHVAEDLGWFLNTGTWAEYDFNYVTLDYTGARLEVFSGKNHF